MSFFTWEWSSFGDQYLRKNEIQSMLWFDYLNLNNCSICFCELAGPIAVIQKNAKSLQINQVNYQERFTIEIFNSFGNKLAEIPWSSKNDTVLAYFDWSSNEELYCVTKKGDIFIYDIKGVLKSTFNLYIQIKDCKFYQLDDRFGLVVLTESNRFQSYSTHNNFKPFKYPELPKTFSDPNTIFCWSIGKSNSTCPDLIFSLDNEIYLLKFISPTYQQLRYQFDLKATKISRICSNLKTDSVAFYLNTGVVMFARLNDLNLISYDEFETKSSNEPDDILWFCNDSLCIVWKDLIVVAKSKKIWVTYQIDEKEPYFIVNEFDGLRIISNKTHEFLEILSQEIVDIFSVCSEKPGAYLLEAYKEFNKKSHLANDYIKVLENDFTLPESIQKCIQAAKSEFKVSTQKLLLRAASYGKCFLPDYDPSEFIDTCLQLRVLNIIREQDVGLPLSIKQFNLIGINRILDRLISLELFSLAIKLSNHLSMDVESGRNKVLKEWALYKVRQNEYDDEKVANDIVRKIGNTNGISYSEIANLAVEYNRKNLAFFLLNYENKSTDQVDLLLKLGNKEEALEKAIESGNTNLIFKVILSKHYQEYPPKILGSILKLIPQAYALYEKYLKETDRFELTNFYHAEERNDDRGFCFLKESFDARNDLFGKKNELHLALESFRLAGNEFMVSATEEQERLISRQKKIVEKLKQQIEPPTDQPPNVVGLSLYETVELLVTFKLYKQADDLRKEFKMTDRKYWFLKIKILAEKADWIELQNFANLKKSPIGYEPFVDACLSKGNKFEAQKLLPKIKEANKVEYFFKSGLVEEAGQLCKQQKNVEALEGLINRCQNTVSKNKLIQYLNEIK